VAHVSEKLAFNAAGGGSGLLGLSTDFDLSLKFLGAFVDVSGKFRLASMEDAGSPSEHIKSASDTNYS
jgi:hypothetical protein